MYGVERPDDVDWHGRNNSDDDELKDTYTVRQFSH